MELQLDNTNARQDGDHAWVQTDLLARMQYFVGRVEFDSLGGVCSSVKREGFEMDEVETVQVEIMNQMSYFRTKGGMLAGMLNVVRSIFQLRDSLTFTNDKALDGEFWMLKNQLSRIIGERLNGNRVLPEELDVIGSGESRLRDISLVKLGEVAREIEKLIELNDQAVVDMKSDYARLNSTRVNYESVASALKGVSES